MVLYSVHGDEPPGSTKCREFLGELKKYAKWRLLGRVKVVVVCKAACMSDDDDDGCLKTGSLNLHGVNAE